VRNKAVSQRVKEERNILQTIKRRNAKLIDDILPIYCLLEHITEGKIEGRIDVT
jgi:hypothetical protein